MVAAERAAAVRIAASIAAHDGGAAQAADLFRWLGPYPDAFVSAAGAIVSIAAGDADAARAALSSESAGPPTSTARAARSLAEGLLLSLDQPFPVAVARLGQSITAEQQPTGVAPDSPAALVTLAALHGGDPVRARSVIGRAVRAGGEDPELRRPPAPAAAGLGPDAGRAAGVGDRRCRGGERRDAAPPRRVVGGGLQTAIARRSGDAGRCRSTGTPRWKCSPSTSIDLFSLLPLGELWIAAARMRQVDRLAHTLDEAFGPAGLAGRSGAVVGAAALGRCARRDPGQFPGGGRAARPGADGGGRPQRLRQALAHAGRTWLRVLANHVDTDEVTAAARSLSQFGLTWDATRLAGQAALQTPDGRVSGAMLQLARDLKQTTAVDEAPGVEAATAAAAISALRTPASVAVVGPRARGRRAVAAGHAVPRYRQPAVHLGEDRRASRCPNPPSARRRITLGDAVDAARHAGHAELS